jgi:hypothetical protein
VASTIPLLYSQLVAADAIAARELRELEPATA